MAYTINLTNGTTLTTIADGTVNQTSTSLTLIGKNYAGYGTFLNDNFVHLLENASNDTAPTTPLTGQLWWDTAGNLKVYTGSAFKTLSAITSSSSQPTGAVTGNQWWDSANQQLNVYNGSSWTLIGPAFTSNTGTSGTIVGTIIDSGNTSHVAVNVYVSNTLVGIYSKDSAYTPGTAITGFTTIKPGFNLVSTGAVSGVAMWGTASDASGLGNVAAANYARTDAAALSETFDIPVYINSDTGITVGTSNTAALSVSSSRVNFDNKINNGDISIRANIGGTVANAIAITGSTGLVTIPNVLAASGNVTTSAFLITTSSATASNTATGALRVTGGAGIGGNIWVGGYANIAGNVTALGINATNGTYSGKIDVTGGNVNASGFYTAGNVSGAYLLGTVNGSQLVDGTVTSSKLDSSLAITNANITTANITTAIISNAQISSGTISNVTLASPTINNANIATPASIVAQYEKATITGSAPSATTNFDAITQAVQYFTSNATTNFTFNIRGNSSTTLNSVMSTGQSVTVVALVSVGSTGYTPNVVQVDGSTVTPKYVNGATPTASYTDGIVAYTYTVIKTASATWTVLGSQTKYA